MNSNFALLLLSLIALNACGVKAKPLSPPETAIKSYIQTYTGTPPEEKKEPTQPSSPAAK